MSGPIQRVEAWLAARAPRVAGHNPGLVALRTAQRFSAVRVTGLAAEMTYYGLVSLLPLLGALGAALGLLERVIGAARVRQFEDAIVRALEGVFSAELTRDLVEPLVRGLLAEERTGAAIGGLLVTLWFAGGAFRAVVRALDDAYRVPERRSMLYQWAVAYALTLGAVLVTAFLLALVVIGPLLGGERLLSGWVGVGRAVEIAWTIGRWPVVAAIAASYLACVYRFGPNVRTRWRDCVPGALLGTAGTLLVAIGFRYYLALASPRAPELRDAAEAVQVAGRTIGIALSVILWLWLTCISVLTGGVFNAELARSRGERPQPKA